MSYVNISVNSEEKHDQSIQSIRSSRCKACAKSVGVASVKCLLCLLGLFGLYLVGAICYYLGKFTDKFWHLPDRFFEHDYDGIARYTLGGVLFLLVGFSVIFLCIRALVKIFACVKCCCKTKTNTNTNTNSNTDRLTTTVALTEIISSEVELEK